TNTLRASRAYEVKAAHTNCPTWSAPFPLTLALSLRERELHRPFEDKPESVGKFQIGKRFSLSPRERVGVRGKGAFLNRQWHVAKDKFMGRELPEKFRVLNP